MIGANPEGSIPYSSSSEKIRTLYHSTRGTGSPKTSSMTKRFSFSLPENLSGGLATNRASGSDFSLGRGFSGVDVLSKL